MKTFKSLLALGMAVAFSSSALAQTTDAVGALKTLRKQQLTMKLQAKKRVQPLLLIAK